MFPFKSDDIMQYMHNKAGNAVYGLICLFLIILQLDILLTVANIIIEPVHVITNNVVF